MPFGYKLIRKVKVSTASEHDTPHLEEILDAGNTSRALYADKGYVDGERESRLKAKGWRVNIQRKAAKGMMCQHFSGHMVKQLFAAIRSLLAINSYWLNAAAHGCKRPQYIQILPVWPQIGFDRSHG